MFSAASAPQSLLDPGTHFPPPLTPFILGKLRNEAEECISYQICAFRQNGMLVGFGATANHCAFYLMSSSTVTAHQHELKDYDTSKGTIRFAADKPLPVALVRKLVKARLAQNARGRRKTK